MSWLLALAARAVALFSWDALARPGAALGWLAGSVLRVRRRAVEAAMARAGVAAPRACASSMYRELGAGVFELLWLSGAPAERRARALDEGVVFDESLVRALDEACARGPVILAASHTGNWELFACAAARLLAARGRRLAAVVKPQSVRAIDAFCMQLRRASGIVTLEPSGAVVAASRSLAAGDVVAMLIDQVPDRARHGVRVGFLGAEALADRAPAALARATGATLLVVAASRDGRRHRGHLLAVLAAHGSGAIERPQPSAMEWTTDATRRATRALEAFVGERPSAWLWMHRRWRAPLEVGPRARVRAPSLVATGHPG